jgi:rhodanese-related sulfurtransferase
MNAIGQLLVVTGISMAAAGGTYLLKGPPVRVIACNPTDLKPDELCLDQVVEPVVWIDARPRKDWEANGLPGSILWNLDIAEDSQAFEMEAAMKIVELPKVVVYCTNEDCGISRQVAEKVKKLGLDADVKVLRGGWQALKDAGRVKDSSGNP